MQPLTAAHPIIFLTLFCFCRQNFFLYVFRNLLVFIKEHGVVTTSLSSGTKVGRITEHLCQRNISLNQLAAADVFHTLDTTTTRVDITDG